jgi:phosphatidylinositol glycan class A protein
LVYRKGTDLLVDVIPKICKLYPKVEFIIAGDGPKRVDLEQMKERYFLEDRVVTLGNIQNSEVREVRRSSLANHNFWLNDH